jgi:hypothetical protein
MGRIGKEKGNEKEKQEARNKGNQERKKCGEGWRRRETGASVFPVFGA